jgi:hypothetical protein
MLKDWMSVSTNEDFTLHGTEGLSFSVCITKDQAHCFR